MISVERMSKVDFGFYNAHTGTTPQTIAAFCLLDRVPDMALLRERVEQVFQRSFPRFRQTVVHNPHPAWIPAPDFVLDNHIEFIVLPEIRDENALVEAASRLFSVPLPSGRPLWRLTVIANRAPDQAGGAPGLVAGMMYAVHHCMADGLGTLDTFYALCDGDGGARGREEAGGAGQAGPADRRSWLARFVVGWRCAMRMVQETVSPPGKSPVNGPNSSQRRATLIRLSRRDLRKIGRALGGSLHDVLMSILAGAFRRYHLAHNLPVRDLRVVVPMSIRHSSQREDMGNLITAVGIRLPISHPAAVDRLRVIHENIERTRTDGSVAAYRFFASQINRLPRKLHRRSWEQMFLNTNFLCTIIPGPAAKKTIAGAGIELLCGFAANNRNHGVSFTFLTYAGAVSLMIVRDPAVLPDARELTEAIHDSFEELRSAASPSWEASRQPGPARESPLAGGPATGVP